MLNIIKQHSKSSIFNSIIEFFKSIFGNYINFMGVSNRSEYWWWILCIFIITLPLDIVMIIGHQLATYSAKHMELGINNIRRTLDFENNIDIIETIFIIATLIVGMAILIPTLALEARRLRDAGIPNSFILGLMIVAHIGIFINSIRSIALLCNIAIIIINLLPTRNNYNSPT